MSHHERYYKAIVPDVLNVIVLDDAQRRFYMGFWRSAAAEKLGLRIEVAIEDTDLMIHGLLQARVEHGGFADIILYSTSTPGVVFLAKRGKRMQ